MRNIAALAIFEEIFSFWQNTESILKNVFMLLGKIFMVVNAQS